MEKLHCQFDQEELVRSAGQMVSIIEGSRHIKEASSNAITRDMLQAQKPDKDHFLVHMIAMGDHEHYGFNRNGDAWPKEACSKYHSTFVSHGHFFREHKNRNATQAIGQIKAACYNEPMGRIELAVWGHVKKAEDVLENVRTGKETSYSMSARVPYDRSSITDKKAKTPDDYDDYCKNRMGQWIPEHKKFAFVYNDHPTFFDISFVKNPADRIAHHLEYFLDAGHQKAASAAIVNGHQRAKSEGVILPGVPEALGCLSSRRQNLLEKLAHLESVLNSGAEGNPVVVFNKYAAQHAFRGELTEAQVDAFRGIQPGTLFRKLAQRQVILPFTSFVAYATGTSVASASESPAVKYAHAKLLSTTFAKVAACACNPEIESTFEPASDFMAQADLRCNDQVDKLFDQVNREFSSSPEKVRSRAIAGSAGENQAVKAASNCAASAAEIIEAENLVYAYGHYKLAALDSMLSFHGDDAQDIRHAITVCHNRNQV